MIQNQLLRWPDLVVMGLNFGVMIGIGVYCARKSKSADAYFLAGRSMPGWVVGFSLMATIVSSMTFLATPGFTYKEDWRYVPSCFMYFFSGLGALYLFMPFFRRGHVRSAYEYLERRFGIWARLYGAGGFFFYQIFRMGIILYAVCLPFETMSGISLPWLIVLFGILVATYTIAGGLEAVIWTDLLQGLALISGGIICLPIVTSLLPGGLSQILSEAYSDGKFSVGSTAFNWNEQTVWVITLVYLFLFFQVMCTDQMTVQRYISIRTDKEARKGLMIGVLMTMPVWIYFSFIGTALYVLYRNFPQPELGDLLAEQIFPYFILTEVPAGAAGFIISGLLAAAMSTLDSSINASAATLTTDFYRRLVAPHREERHYVRVGRWLSVVFGIIMIAVALLIHFTRTQTLMDLQTLLLSILSGGILSLFLLGFLTQRVGSRSALVATICTVSGICLWLFLDSSTGVQWMPGVTRYLPDKFWIIVFSNILLFGLGYILSRFWVGEAEKDLSNLTVWTRIESSRK